MTENSSYERWLADDRYFSTLAILALGPLHPMADKANDALSLLAREHTGPVLEIGMGLGWTHRFLSQQGIEVFSVENNEYMIDTALRNGVDSSRVVNSTVEAFLEKNELDRAPAIVCFQAVLAFLDNPMAVLAKIISLKSLRCVQIVDWYPETNTTKKIRITSTNLSEIIAVLEAGGFSNFRLSSSSYSPKVGKLSREEVLRRVRLRFPEARELGGEDVCMDKAASITETGVPKHAFCLSSTRLPTKI